jgi:hypothetical protein
MKMKTRVKSPPQLARFQAEMARAIMRPLGPGDAMRRENRPVATEFVKPNERLASADRLQIYNQQYWWRLLGSFGEDFGGLRAVLGERKFDRLARAYLADCGSTSWNLRDLGQGLAAYLAAHPDLVAPYGDLAREMVAVEWARVVAFDGEKKPVIDPSGFARRDPAKIKLGLQPYITLLELRYPVDHLLRRLKHSEQSSSSNAVREGKGRRRLRLSAKMAPQPVHLAVHRSDLIVYYKRLDPAACRLLVLLRGGESLNSACELAFADSDRSGEEIASLVRSWFTAWVSFGWLCRPG